MEQISGEWKVVHRTLGGDFYGGTSGIGVFLARLFAVTGEKLFRTTSRAAIERALSAASSIFPAGRIGFYSGATGIAYAAIIAGELLHDPGLVERGLAMLEDLQEDDPDGQPLDVISGSAGAIPVLLGFEEKYQKNALGLLAKRHGDRLLNSARRRAEGWSWDTLQTSNGYDLTGFSHGTSGIAWALLELSQRTGIETFQDAAFQGFAYERRHYDNETENWPDFRTLNEPGADRNRKPGFGVAWCHGAPGIGLARLRAYEIAGDDLWRSEALAALRTTGKYLEPDAIASQNFSLCHGLAGNAELSLLARRAFKDDGYAKIAEAVGYQGIELYQKARNPWPCGVIGGGETPNLMLGLAGIGYFYLRLCEPDKVPSVLIVTPCDILSATRQ